LPVCFSLDDSSVDVQRFILLLGQDEAPCRVIRDAACLSIALALCWINEKESPLDQTVIQTKKAIHTLKICWQN
jgi:hypothetical protein